MISTNIIIALFIIFVFLCIISRIMYIEHKLDVDGDMEKFENEQNTKLDIRSNRMKYLEYGLINFISHEKHIDKISNGDTANRGSPYIFIYPNNIDIMCNATTLTDDKICQDINVMKSFERDDAPIYRNERRANVISGVSKISSTNNSLRIFDSEYNLKNRSILLSIKKVDPFVNKQSGNKYWYCVTVTGNVKTFVMSRPFFITINEFGLYKIVYDSVADYNKESNMFVSYSSQDDEHKFYIEKIEDDKVFPSTTNEIRDTVSNGEIKQKLKSDTPITIYYAVFNRTLPMKEFDVNSFSIHLNKVKLEKEKLIQTMANMDFSSGSESSDKINSFQIHKDKNDQYRYFFTIGHRSSPNTKIELPEGFVPSKYSSYDIIIIYSYDVMTIVCFAKDSKTEYCFMERRVDKNYNLILETTKKNLELQFLPLADSYLSLTANPYLPTLAYKYGYTLQ